MQGNSLTCQQITAILIWMMKTDHNLTGKIALLARKRQGYLGDALKQYHLTLCSQGGDCHTVLGDRL